MDIGHKHEISPEQHAGEYVLRIRHFETDEIVAESPRIASYADADEWMEFVRDIANAAS